VEDSQSGFRLYPAHVLERIKLPYGKDRGFVFESEVLIECVRLGFSVAFVPIATRGSAGHRPSHFRPILDTLRIGCMLASKLIGPRRRLTPIRTAALQTPIAIEKETSEVGLAKRMP
jgi:hypothetical protein